jgi:hypothetical protein
MMMMMMIQLLGLHHGAVFVAFALDPTLALE